MLKKYSIVLSNFVLLKEGKLAYLNFIKRTIQINLDLISEELSKAMGATLIFDYKVDKALIGGLKLQLGSFMIDTSIKNKLKKYEQSMLEN